MSANRTPATRTQVYLSQEQRKGIDRAARAKGVTLAAVIRAAVDEYLASTGPDDALAATFGADPDVVVPDRSEWDRG